MFHAIIFKNYMRMRASIDDENFWEVRKCWNKIARYVSRDFPGFLAYMRDEMTEDEVGWLSDALEQGAELALAPGFMESLAALATRMPECAARLGISTLLARFNALAMAELGMEMGLVDPQAAIAVSQVSEPAREPSGKADKKAPKCEAEPVAAG